MTTKLIVFILMIDCCLCIRGGDLVFGEEAFSNLIIYNKENYFSMYSITKSRHFLRDIAITSIKAICSQELYYESITKCKKSFINSAYIIKNGKFLFKKEIITNVYIDNSSYNSIAVIVLKDKIFEHSYDYSFNIRPMRTKDDIKIVGFGPCEYVQSTMRSCNVHSIPSFRISWDRYTLKSLIRSKYSDYQRDNDGMLYIRYEGVAQKKGEGCIAYTCLEDLGSPLVVNNSHAVGVLVDTHIKTYYFSSKTSYSYYKELWASSFFNDLLPELWFDTNNADVIGYMSSNLKESIRELGKMWTTLDYQTQGLLLRESIKRMKTKQERDRLLEVINVIDVDSIQYHWLFNSTYKPSNIVTNMNNQDMLIRSQELSIDCELFREDKKTYELCGTLMYNDISTSLSYFKSNLYARALDMKERLYSQNPVVHVLLIKYYLAQEISKQSENITQVLNNVINPRKVLEYLVYNDTKTQNMSDISNHFKDYATIYTAKQLFERGLFTSYIKPSLEKCIKFAPESYEYYICTIIVGVLKPELANVACT